MQLALFIDSILYRLNMTSFVCYTSLFFWTMLDEEANHKTTFLFYPPPPLILSEGISRRKGWVDIWSKHEKQEGVSLPMRSLRTLSCSLYTTQKLLDGVGSC